MRGSLTGLAVRSLRNRLATALLVVATIALGVALIVGVQRIRGAGEAAFASALPGTDLVVGARTGDVNLLLLSVFGIGDATANVSWETYRKLASHRDVAWAVPISLGDMHRGFRVQSTTADYFRHFRQGGQPLRFADGRPFSETFDAVVGADVARALGYGPGREITLSHGTGTVSFLGHDEQPFRISGVLARTGTPVDRTVHIALEAMTALHHPGDHDGAAAGVTAVFVGLESRALALQMQRAINTHRGEALTAILPQATLEQLWELVGVVDDLLTLVAALVVVASLMGMMTALLAGLNERRREMALLRAIGARPRHVFGLLVAEAALLACAGTVAGATAAIALQAASRPVLLGWSGIDIGGPQLPGAAELRTLGAVMLASLVAGLVPAWRACASSLADGLQPRI